MTGLLRWLRERLARLFIRYRLWPIHRLVHRRGSHSACVVCRAVWADMLRDPRYRSELKQGIADVDAGRWYTYDSGTGIFTPNPDWPTDGPQPDPSHVPDELNSLDDTGYTVDDIGLVDEHRREGRV